MKKFVITFVKYEMSGDGKPHCIDIVDTLEIAKDVVQHEIDNFVEDFKMNNWDEEDIDIDYEDMSVLICGGEHGGEWNIEPIEFN